MSLDQSETIGERIKRLREERGLSHEELAIGIFSKEMLQIIELNMGRPSNTVKKELAARLGVTVDYFLSTENKMLKRRVWEHVNLERIEGFGSRRGILYKHNYFPNHWRFSSNIILAYNYDEAIQKLKYHASLCETDKYWNRYGSSHFVVKIFGYTGSLFQHKVEKDCWLWNDYVCIANSFDDWLATVKREFFTLIMSQE